MAAVADGPLLVCHDGSEGAKHAIERAGAIWRTILEIADRRDAAMIVMGPGDSRECARCCWKRLQRRRASRRPGQR